jgi:dTDP-glucose pyrophosphorylase
MNWKEVAVHPEVSIRKVIDIIDRSGAQIALVTNADNKLLGTVTDGDIRRGILRGVDLDASIDKIYNSHPVTANEFTDSQTIVKIMKTKFVRQLPILDEKGRVIHLKLLKDIPLQIERPNTVIIMAGGQGRRLRPLTDGCPKPMLKIDGKPILEIILKSLERQGFKKVYISINYKGKMISDYFGDGSNLGLRLDYLHEHKKLGTAGSLSLLKDLPSSPLLVLNGDLLTKVNFIHMIDFHLEHNSLATMGVIEYGFQVPYGVIELKEHFLVNLDEKPFQKFFVNAGIYVLQPSVLSFIPTNQKYDMTQLFHFLIQQQGKITAFPIREFWLDIGNMEDFERASREFTIG